MTKSATSHLLPVFARVDLGFERGEGAWLIATNGERYLDFTSGVAVNALGHAHPHLVAALQEQATKLWHMSNLFKSPDGERLAARLCEQSFADFVFFANSGAEAMECAIKVTRKYHAAKGHPERYRIITFDGAFHGRTLATLAATGSAKYLEGFGPPMDGFDQVLLGDLEAVKKAIGPHTAGILIEPLQGEGGVRAAPHAFFKALRQLCDDNGLLLIFDEVQTGMGRTGDLFAYKRIGVTPDVIKVVHGDTDQVQYGVGTFGSRGTAVGGSALKLAIETIQAKAIRIAAHQWEANPDDLEYRDGKIGVRGDSSKSMTTPEAGFLAFMGDKLPPGLEPGLDATRRFEPPNFVYPFGTHVCVVEVDAETGGVEIVRYVAVDDCGKVLNPMIVEGQVHGGIAQGMAQALYEEVVYDEYGQLLTGTLLDYAVPHAEQVPHFELDRTVTETTVNPLGVKGAGEAGAIGSCPAVVNAIIEGLWREYKIDHIDMPATAERVWIAIREHQRRHSL